jgi:hypothetical protein
MPSLNTLGTLNGTLIAQRALRTLLAAFPMIGKVARNFDSEGKVKFGQQLIAHLPTAAAPAADYNVDNGYVATGRTQVNIPVTLNNHVHHTYEVNDQERSSTAVNLIERFAVTAAYSIGLRFYADFFALIKKANFGNGGQNTVIVSQGFSRDNLVDMGVALNIRNVLPIERFAVLNPYYAGALFKDRAVISRDYVDGRPAVTAQLGIVHNFDCSEYSALPDNAEGLGGIAGSPEAFGIVTALPEPPDVKEGGQMTVVTEPESGLSLLMRQWYDWNAGKEKRTYTLMYGVAVGVKENLQLLSAQ